MLYPGACVDAETRCDFVILTHELEEQQMHDDDSSFNISQEETESEDDMRPPQVSKPSFRKNTLGSRVCLGEQASEESTALIIYWSCLYTLLCLCISCTSQAIVTKKIIYGSALFIEQLCSKGRGNNKLWSAVFTTEMSSWQTAFYLVQTLS